MTARATVPHPVVWAVLYLPFGALGGFVTVPLTFQATQHGLSITEGALLGGAQLVSQWLKWSWAPVVDVTATPKRWYVAGTTLSATGVLAMAMTPMSQETLPRLLVVIAIASLVNSIVGMAIEAIMAAATDPADHGRTSAWFQAGNLGGAGLGGGLGMTLYRYLPEPWMVGAVMAALFLCCCAALWFVPDVEGHRVPGGPAAAVKGVFRDIGALARTQGGLLAAVICFLPIGTGAGQAVLTQAAVAAHWGAGALQVEAVQGYTSAVVTAAGCFAGGWWCDRVHPRVAYASFGVAMAVVAALMGLGPATPWAYVAGNLGYAFVVGLAYAAFTAVVLNAIGRSSGATKYNLYASLSNFPIWWLGLLLGRVADVAGARAMLYTEAGLGLVAILVFFAVSAGVGRTSLPRSLAEEPA